MTNISDDDKLKLQKDAGIPNLPTDLTYECRMAIAGEGPRAYDWSDKPHRLVYDLCREIEAQAAARSASQRDIALAREYLGEVRSAGNWDAFYHGAIRRILTVMEAPK